MPGGSALDAMRASLEIEVTRAERLEARARMEVTLAAAWFALVQAVVTVGLKTGMAPAWEIAVGAGALAATAALVVAAWYISRVWRLRPDPTVTRETLAEVSRTLRSSPGEAGEQIAEEYERVVGYAQRRNEARIRGLKAAGGWWWIALACALAELGLALAARLLTV